MSELHLDKMERFSDGTPVCIARPAKPERALEIARLAINTAEWKEAQTRLDEECGPYTFVGYMGKRRRGHKGPPVVVSETGARIGLVQPGDSFVAYDFWNEGEGP